MLVKVLEMGNKSTAVGIELEMDNFSDLLLYLTP